MSLSNRATSKGGKGAKADKSHKSDKTESGKAIKEFLNYFDFIYVFFFRKRQWGQTTQR